MNAPPGASIEAFARYHEHGAQADDPREGVGVRAATWERMALLRARAAAGDPAIGAEAMRIAEACAYERGGDPRALAAEVHRLRQRMQRELSHERPGRYDLKLGRLVRAKAFSRRTNSRRRPRGLTESTLCDQIDLRRGFHPGPRRPCCDGW
jgi:hypothetical protein